MIALGFYLSPDPSEEKVSNAENEISNDTPIETNEKDHEDDAFVEGDIVDGELDDIVANDDLLSELKELGFTEQEANDARRILLICGIESVEGFEPTSSTASIDDLISFRKVIDKDRIAWFTVDHRKVFYVSLNGVDLYDSDKGGFLININDVHVPESYISVETANTLQDITERTLDQYFVKASYYDAFGYAREDDNYMVQCQAYASNRLGMKEWVSAKVWFEDQNGEFEVVGIVIDGQRYQ